MPPRVAGRRTHVDFASWNQSAWMVSDSFLSCLESRGGERGEGKGRRSPRHGGGVGSFLKAKGWGDILFERGQRCQEGPRSVVQCRGVPGLSFFFRGLKCPPSFNQRKYNFTSRPDPPPNPFPRTLEGAAADTFQIARCPQR